LVQATAKGRKLLQEGRRRRVARLAEDLQRHPARDRATLERAAALLEELALPTMHPKGGVRGTGE
jgi:hypothetical protein